MTDIDFGEFKGEIDNDHRHSSAVLLKMDANGDTDPDGRTDCMSVRFVYAETPEDMMAVLCPIFCTSEID